MFSNFPLGKLADNVAVQDFDTPFKMQEHFEEIHLKKGSSSVCR
jgi:hypothetical protein